MLAIKSSPQILSPLGADIKPEGMSLLVSNDPSIVPAQNWMSISLPAIEITNTSLAKASPEPANATIVEPSVTYREAQLAPLPTITTNWPLVALACTALLSRIFPRLGFKVEG